MTATPSQWSPFVVHSDRRVLYASEALCSLFDGWSRDEIIDEPVFELVTAAYHDPLAAQFEQLSSQDASALGLKATLETRPGSDREVIIVSSPIEWDGEMALQSTIVDLSDQLSAGPIFRQAMDAAPVGITIADATVDDEPLVYVSEGFAEITGYTREEATGRNCRFLQGERTRDEPVARMRRAIKAEKPVTVVLRNYRTDGGMFWNRVTITPIRDEAGTVTHLLGYQEDVSERKLHEQEKTLFERHAEAANHAMFITSRDGEIEYVNPAFERMTGYTAAEAIGRTPRILKSGQQDDTFYDGLWDAITTGDVWEREITNRKKSGELYRVRQTIVPIVDDYEEVTHFAAIEYDISEQEFTEQVVDVMNRVLRHNLRTSVNIIDGYAELLSSRLDDPELHAAVGTISDHATALEGLSDKTTAVRKLFENRNEHQPAELSDITEFVDYCRQKHDDATIDCTVSADDPVAVKNGRLIQVAIEETIENAVVHSDRHYPRIDVTLSQSPDTNTLTVAIADDGPGIPDEEWESITAGHETPLVHGSGIGLWLIYWAITALGGTVELTANDPRGSVLTYRVPIVTDSP